MMWVLLVAVPPVELTAFCAWSEKESAVVSTKKRVETFAEDDKKGNLSSLQCKTELLL
jgi:hypothetical protein